MSVGTRVSTGLRPLRSGRFAVLWLGLTISVIGDGMYITALVIGFSGREQAAQYIAVAGAAFFLPQLGLMLVGGVFADRYSRSRIISWASLAKALAVTAMAWMIAGEAPPMLWAVALAAAAFGAAESFAAPALMAIVPSMVPDEDVPAAISLRQLADTIGVRLIGPILGGLISAAWSASGVLLLDVLTFLILSTMAFAIRVPRRETNEPGVGTAALWSSLFQDMKAGLAFVRRSPWLLGLLGISAVGLLVTFGPTQALVPLLVKQLPGATARDVGLALSAAGIGGVVASTFGSMTASTKRPIAVILVSWALAGTSVALIGLCDRLWQVMVMMAAESLFSMTGFLAAVSLIAKLTPGDMLGRVSSLDDFVSNSLIPVSFLLAGVAATAASVGSVLIVGGLVELIVVMVALSLTTWQRLPEAA